MFMTDARLRLTKSRQTCERVARGVGKQALLGKFCKRSRPVRGNRVRHGTRWLWMSMFATAASPQRHDIVVPATQQQNACLDSDQDSDSCSAPGHASALLALASHQRHDTIKTAPQHQNASPKCQDIPTFLSSFAWFCTASVSVTTAS